MKVYVGFISCPVCKKEIAHYLALGRPEAKNYLRIFCDECKVIRLIHKSDELFNKIKRGELK